MAEAVEGRVFVPNGESRRETAILLVGTADEYDIDQRQIKATSTGFDIPQELADVLNYDEPDDEGTEEDSTEEDEGFLPADHTVEQVKDFVNENPETADDVLLSEQAGKNRSSLVEWLTGFINETSGDRAAKNSTDSEE